MSDAPALSSGVTLVVALVFMAVPAVVIGHALRTRRRARTWTPTTAVLRRVRTETRGGEDSRTVLVGTYEYRDTMGVTRTGEGDLGSVGVAVDGSEQHVPVLVDPLDGTRSMIDPGASGATAALGCFLPVAAAFFLIGLGVLVVTVDAMLGRS